MALSKYQIVSISLGVGAAVLAIILCIIPFILDKNLKANFQKISNPTINNIDIWAKFPGKLKSTLNHSFKFINTEDNKSTLTKEETLYEESIFYENIKEKEGQLSFDNKREFKFKGQTDGKVKTVSLGMLEMFNTLSNPPIYKEAISSMMYLIDYSFGSAEEFIRKLFTAKAFKEIISDQAKLDDMLKGITDAAKKTLIKTNELYGLSKIGCFYKWALLVRNQELIQKATWLTEVLRLTEAEINSLLGDTSVLVKAYDTLNGDLVTKFKCPQKPCGNELIYQQMIDQSVSSFVGQKDLKELLNNIDPKSYPFKYPPEMKHYYDYLKKTDYAKDQLTIEQLKLMLDSKSSAVLLEPSNSIFLFQLNRTRDLTASEAKFKIKEQTQLTFVTEYFFNFLPSNFLYSSFTSDNKNYQINPLAKAYSSLMSLFVDKTYGSLKSNGGLYALILQKLVYALIIKDPSAPNICPILFQKVVGDGRRVLKICTNKELNLESEISIANWMKTFVCKRNNCQTEYKDKVKKLGPFSDAEIDRIFSVNSLGKFIIDAEAKISVAYKCGGRCSEEYLTRLQYTTCDVTKKPPNEIIPANTVTDWSNVDFPEPVELKYYQNKAGCTEEDCNSKSNEALLNLNGLSADKANRRTSTEVYFRQLFEKINTVIFLGQKPTEQLLKEINVVNAQNYFSIINNLITSKILNDVSTTEYSSKSILLGNNNEDKTFIDLLKKGSIYDHYNPKASQTTGFAIGNKDEIKTDNYVIDAKQEDKKILRAIMKMNNAPYMSINKKEYSSVKNKMVDVISPIFSNYTLDDTLWASDGFQYSSDLNVIYYYDELSSRLFEFRYQRYRAYGNISCYEYLLNSDFNQKIRESRDIQKEGYGEASQKFNKPFVVAASNSVQNINNMPTQQDSFICVDPYSNMVLESNISLIYSVNTGNYFFLNNKIAQNTTYPLILYTRSYSMDSPSYSLSFEGLSGHNTKRLLLIIIGVIFIVLLVALCAFFWYKHTKVGSLDELKGKTENVHEGFLPPGFNSTTEKEEA